MWKPGESGNPAGAAKVKRFLAALDRAIIQDDGKQLRQAADALLAKAAEGEQWAVQMLADRLDGKPAQTQVVQGSEEGGPVKHDVSVTFVHRASEQA